MSRIDPNKDTTNTYEIKDEAYVKAKEGDNKRRIDIEIGDTKTKTDFIPQFKTLLWGNECNFSARLKDTDYTTGVIKTNQDTIEWIKGDVTARFYEKQAYSSENGGFEFEVEFAAKPSSNVVTFTIETKGLAFFYQGHDPKPYKKGATVTRPDHVKGSYAVYHSSKKDNWLDKEYLTGKAFHLYRPFAIDKNNTEVWCELNIDEQAGEMTITVPQGFLDNASYPVIIDPTFGFTSIGGTEDGPVSDDTMVGNLFALVEDASVTSLSMYGRSSSGTPAFSVGIYDDNSTDPNNFVDSGAGTLTTTNGWRTTGATSISLSTASYWLMRFCAAAWYGYYDEVTADFAFQSGLSYPTFPDPASAGVLTDLKFSAYATYTATGGATRRIMTCT